MGELLREKHPFASAKRSKSVWRWVSHSPVMPDYIKSLEEFGAVVRHEPPELAGTALGTMLIPECKCATCMRILGISHRPAPVVVVGCDDPEQRVGFLKAGADDVLDSCTTSAEAHIRVTELIRRYEWRDGRLDYGNLRFDVSLKLAWVNDVPLTLMPKEFDVLLYLLRKAGALATRDELLSNIWQLQHDPGTNSVVVHICRLRKRLAGIEGAPSIETIKGRGYSLTLPR